MQSMDLKIFCPRCREPTYREVRYRSDPQFIGRVLVCEHCGERILEPLGPGGSARTVDEPGNDVADGPTPATQRESTETKTQYHQASLNRTVILGRLQLSYYELWAILSLVFYRLAWSSWCSIW